MKYLIKAIVTLFTFPADYLARLGICSLVGLIAGASAGLILSIYDLVHAPAMPAQSDLLTIVGLLTVFAWIVCVFILVALQRLTLRSVALKTLANAFLTVAVTVAMCHQLQQYSEAWLIGMIVGIIIGQLLCRINDLFLGRKELR